MTPTSSRFALTRLLTYLSFNSTNSIQPHTSPTHPCHVAFDEQKKWEPPLPTRVGKKKKRGPDPTQKRKSPSYSRPKYRLRASTLGKSSVPEICRVWSPSIGVLTPPLAHPVPTVYPNTRCRLKLLKMERIKDHLLMEEEFVQNQERLKPTLLEDKTVEDRTRVDDLRGSPMSVGTLEEIIDDDHAIVSSATGPEYYVSIMSFVDKDQLEPGCAVLLHHKTMSIVGVLQDDADPMVSMMKVDKAPTESYADIGGLEQQIQEIKESVELPLTHPELYEEMGIKPPKGVILYGVPGTGKTLLAKAVANQTSATFLRIVGSELIQKYLGDGPKLVRELFRVAEELAPSIVFIDEIDAVGTKRYDSNSGGEREIQRTMLELLNQLDGFDGRGDVKVIMATNKIETLDPALIRPGRIDRKIEFPLPDIKTKRYIFKIHTSRMSLGPDVDLEEFVHTKDDLSGADIKAVCTEAGLLALRERRMQVTMVDFKAAREKVLFQKKDEGPQGLSRALHCIDPKARGEYRVQSSYASQF
ncbi:26S proteasome regulatory subunit T2, partial [Phenoliferia sp. Uapishka_3]